MELCIDFGGTEIKLALIDHSRVVASDRIPVGGTIADLDTAVAASRSLIEHLGATPDSVGLAVPGVAEPTSGRMLHANAKYDFLRDLNLHGWAADQLALPAVVENDARAALIGETAVGSAIGERDAVLVTLGTGIGTAVMMDGVALRGTTGHAGVLGGHVTTDIHGPTCPCGNIGCAEALASAWALRDGTVKELFASDEHADVRTAFLHVWAATVVTLCHMYDPAVVILSGGILRAGDTLRAPIEAYVREHLWPSMTAPRFVVPPQPEFSVARGLSLLARRAHPGSPYRADQETK